MGKVDEGMLRAVAIPASDVAWIVAKAKYSEECRRHLGGAQHEVDEAADALEAAQTALGIV